jgi:hypothetical protein
MRVAFFYAVKRPPELGAAGPDTALNHPLKTANVN